MFIEQAHTAPADDDNLPYPINTKAAKQLQAAGTTAQRRQTDTALRNDKQALIVQEKAAAARRNFTPI